MLYIKRPILYFFQFSAILLLLAVVFSCKKSPEINYVNPVPVPPATPVPAGPLPFPTSGKKFLALGDSYTIGQSVSIDQRFPYQTARLLLAEGTAVMEPTIIATTGWTTGDLIGALQSNPPANNNDIVTLLIGVNNQYQRRSQEEYRTEFTTLLNNAITYAGGNKKHVFVLSIPDYSVTPFASGSDKEKIAREIDEFNAINKEITLRAGISYIDITPISRRGATDATLQATDGLHPSGKQYGLWADLLAPVIKASF